MIRIQPEIKDPQLLRLFHLGAHAQWTSRDYPRFLPEGWDRRAALALARIITPVYLGEQSAMLGANRAIDHFSERNETSYTIYLASFMMDEARHLEALTRLYEELGYPPTGIRELPDMLRYHHRMRAGKSMVKWVMGILISDIFAKHFYKMLSTVHNETPLGQMATRVIIDESRHQAFAEHYLKARLPHTPDDERKELWDLKEDLLSIVGRMAGSLNEDARVLDIDGPALFENFKDDVRDHCVRVGLTSRCRACPFQGEKAPDWSQLSGGGCACDALIPTPMDGSRSSGN